jgi:hypothetical protein
MSYYVHLVTLKPKARKPHRCIWCGEQIDQGETYVLKKGVYEGYQMQTTKWHAECDTAACDWFDKTGEDEMPAAGEMGRGMSDYKCDLEEAAA